jgi:hypothetical protein
MPSQAAVTDALATLDQVSVLCNPAALTKIAKIRAVLESVYPQQSAPVAQAAPVSASQAAPVSASSQKNKNSQSLGLGYLKLSMGSDDPRSETYAPPSSLDAGMGSSYNM